MNWVAVKRTSDVNSKRPLVTFRSSGRGEIGLNASLISEAKAQDALYVEIYLSADHSKLAISFVRTRPGGSVPEHAYRLTLDSRGEKKTSGRVVTAPSLKKNPQIKKIYSFEEAELRRFEPIYDPGEKRWIVYLRPNFEIVVFDRFSIPKGVHGIYRYVSVDQVVYIGRGNIRDRADIDSRKYWDYSTIEYSIVKDEQERIDLEGFYIEYHLRLFGKLPLYNRVSGFTQK